MKKNLWIIKIGEPLIFDSKKERLLRSSILAHSLDKNKYRVTYFVDSFNHFKKQFRLETPSYFQGVNYIFLRSCGYKKNRSIKRIIHNLIISFDFFINTYKIVKKPDVIIVSFPPILLTFCASLFSKYYNIKFVIDFRDAWPDIFFKNKYLKFLIKKVSYPFINFSIKNSYSLTGCAPFFSKFISNYSSTNFSNKYNFIPHSYYSTTKSINNNLDNSKKSQNHYTLVYLGVLSSQRRIEEFIKIFKKVKLNSLIRLYICGGGDQLDYLSMKYRSKNIIFTGHINVEKMNYYSSISDYGIAPYELNEGFKYNIPNKIIEYLQYGLPIITNLKSDLILDLNKEYNKKIIFSYKNQIDLVNILNGIIDKNDMPLNKKEIFKIYQKKYSPPSMVKSFESII